MCDACTDDVTDSFYYFIFIGKSVACPFPQFGSNSESHFVAFLISNSILTHADFYR